MIDRARPPLCPPVWRRRAHGSAMTCTLWSLAMQRWSCGGGTQAGTHAPSGTAGIATSTLAANLTRAVPADWMVLHDVGRCIEVPLVYRVHAIQLAVFTTAPNVRRAVWHTAVRMHGRRPAIGLS